MDLRREISFGDLFRRPAKPDVEAEPDTAGGLTPTNGHTVQPCGRNKFITAPMTTMIATAMNDQRRSVTESCRKLRGRSVVTKSLAPRHFSGFGTFQGISYLTT